MIRVLLEAASSTARYPGNRIRTVPTRRCRGTTPGPARALRPLLTLLAGALTLTLTLPACTDDPARPLSSAERKAIASAYADSVRLLTPRYDSLCEATFDAQVATLADSLFRDRRDDLERQQPLTTTANGE